MPFPTRRARLSLTTLLINLLISTIRLAKATSGGFRDSCPINTTSGLYNGHPAIGYANITEYLGISYAKPPIGELRFAAPKALVSEDLFEADSQPYDCPYVSDKWGSVPGQAWSHADRIMAQESADGYNAMSEDCLKVNIWSPKEGYRPKAAMVWIYGGGFERGSINNPAYRGANLAANEDVIVVSFNFRTNIFGFSNAPGTTTNNGLRDVRLAIEWIRDNIAAFGGDPSRISLFGQSQGAYLISYYAFAFYQDPIAHAFIQQSGSAWSPITQSTSDKASIWRNASAAVGCDQTTDLQVVECMRNMDLSSVLVAWSSVPPFVFAWIPFGPAIDDELVFANYTQRTLEHKVSENPVLMGNNDNEAGFYVLRYGGEETFNLSTAAQDYIGYGLYVCPVAAEAATRANAGYPVYRYKYIGDWPNLELYAGSRAYRTAETSLVFGTMEQLSGDPNVELEVTVSRYMQHAWASFSKDPYRGLEKLGWPLYNRSGDTLIRLGQARETSASYVSPAAFDEMCEKFK